MNYEIVIGLEVHIQSKTKSKMFCNCSSEYFGADANTHTCPVCLGLPGALPVPNKYAIDLCVKLALAMNCSINQRTKFDRKSYFYPDLSKGYQISQYDLPVGFEGHTNLTLKDSEKSIRIKRIHQEEDTGKSVHNGTTTLLDYNKSGVSLIEIVTEPDFNSTEEVKVFAENLRQIVRYLDISDADMEKGQMRFELNMSLRPIGHKELPKYKVEVKNIGSISVLEKVIESEVTRQSEILDAGQLPDQETRGLVNMSGKTRSQRKKESEADYRYFPEPDIPVLELSDAYIAEIKESLAELPSAKRTRYMNDYGFDLYMSSVITSDRDVAIQFERMISGISDMNLIKESAKWFIGENMAMRSKSEPHQNFSLLWLPQIVKGLIEKKYTKETAVEIFRDAFLNGQDPTKTINSANSSIISDSNIIGDAVAKVMETNQKAISDFRSGKNPNAIMFLIGQVMKELKGKADITTVKSEVEKSLGTST